MTQSLYDQMINSKTGFGQMMLRDVLLPSILGAETDGILYWAGKDIARQFPVASDDNLSTLFNQLDLGTLELIKKNNKQQVWHLTGDEIMDRSKLEHASFNFEAGLIAQQVEFMTNAVTEASIEVEKKKMVQITVYHDFSNPITDETPVNFITLAE